MRMRRCFYQELRAQNSELRTTDPFSCAHFILGEQSFSADHWGIGGSFCGVIEVCGNMVPLGWPIS